MKKKALLCMAACVLMLTAGVGCSKQQDTDLSISAGQTEQSEIVSAVESEIQVTVEGQTVTAPVYIGSNGNFKEILYSFHSAPTPEQLIEAIAKETGWNLTLESVTTASKGGFIVSFAKQSTIFTDNLESQKEEYRMVSTKQLVQTILDSIQQTLQKNISSTINDPAAQNIYFCMEGNKPLVLSNIQVTIPMESAYTPDIWNYLSESPKG